MSQPETIEASQTPSQPQAVVRSQDALVREKIRLRLSAIYHTCMSQACFKAEDAWKAGDDKMEALACRREARAFEEAAGWINAAIRELPNPSHHDGAVPAPSVDGVVGTLNQEDGK